MPSTFLTARMFEYVETRLRHVRAASSSLGSDRVNVAIIIQLIDTLCCQISNYRVCLFFNLYDTNTDGLLGKPDICDMTDDLRATRDVR